MLTKMNITWNCKQIANMMKKGKLTFDNVVQRSYVWERKRKSELIHSLIEGYPVPPFYARRVDGTVYDFLDGKQRMNSIADYINGEYALTEIPMISFENEDGNVVWADVSNKRFDELPEEVKDTINSYSLTIYYYDQISDDEVAILFRKLNNGKPLSVKERNIANCRDIKTLMDIGKHPYFTNFMSIKARDKRNHIPMIMKMNYMLTSILNGEDVNFESKNFNSVMADTVLTETEINNVNDILDCLFDVMSDDALTKITRKKIKTETHLISIVPFIHKANEAAMDIKLIVDFLNGFFGTEKETSSNKNYNEACSNGIAKTANVMARHKALDKAWNKFFKEDKKKEEVKEEEKVNEIEQENDLNYTEEDFNDYDMIEDGLPL